MQRKISYKLAPDRGIIFVVAELQLMPPGRERRNWVGLLMKTPAENNV